MFHNVIYKQCNGSSNCQQITKFKTYKKGYDLNFTINIFWTIGVKIGRLIGSSSVATQKSVEIFPNDLKGWQLDASCHRPHCTVTLNSNFAILKKKKKNEIIVFNQSKIIIRAYCLCEEKATGVFCLRKHFFL